MVDPKPPKMMRSRVQLATVYAPHSLFMFEGGVGACMALPAPNRPYEPTSTTTKDMIHEQIVEFLTSWLHRATSGQNTVVPVSPARAVDSFALRGGGIHLPIGNLHFQIPERVNYVPFPAAFVCARCGFYRACDNESQIAQKGSQFAEECPKKPCANDWQQLDVVLVHWSGEVEPISPLRRHVGSETLEVHSGASCSTCNSQRFYLRRDGATFARWRFECVDCRTSREIRLQDGFTLEELKAEVVAGTPVMPQINMEPISCRASAAYYPQGDRLLVFRQNDWISLLQGVKTAALGRFLAEQYGFPSPDLDDSEKERLLRDAGRENEWKRYVGLKNMAQAMEKAGQAVEARFLRETIEESEKQWREKVFASYVSPPTALNDAITVRQNFIRRFDPIRLAVEHRTLLEERLRSRATLPDGKPISVDVTRPDEFMLPDIADTELQRQAIISGVAKRLPLLGMAEMRLIRALEICEYTFGYTRTSPSPLVMRQKAGNAEMPVRFRLFDHVKVENRYPHPVLCLEQSNEAFYVRLDEQTVVTWLSRNGLELSVEETGPRLGGRLIEAYPLMHFSRFLDEYRRDRSMPRQAYSLVYTLLHTMAHHLIGASSLMSGLDVGSFGEHLFVPDLAFVVYRRGMTMDLGNLSSMWRDRGDLLVGNELLERMVSAESLRCGSESICTHHGGACPDCLLIPETACLTRNELLSRSVLSGRGTPRWDAETKPLVGFYAVAAELAANRATRP